jgi:hypothetical protein
MALYGWLNTSRYKVYKSLLEGDRWKAIMVGKKDKKPPPSEIIT